MALIFLFPPLLSAANWGDAGYIKGVYRVSACMKYLVQVGGIGLETIMCW